MKEGEYINMNEVKRTQEDVEESANFLKEEAMLFQKIWDNLKEKDGKFLFDELNKLNNTDDKETKSGIDRIIEYYENDKEGKERPVNALRLNIAKKIKKGEYKNYKDLDDEVRKIVLEEDGRVKNEFKGWYNSKIRPDNFSILHSFFIIPKVEKMKENCEKIKGFILKKLCETYDYQGEYTYFGGDRNYGTTEVWFKFWPKSIEDHKDAIQLILCINSRGFFIEEMAGSMVTEAVVNELGLKKEDDSKDSEDE